MVAAKAGKLLAGLPLADMSRAREDSQAADVAEAERLRDMTASRFITRFRD